MSSVQFLSLSLFCFVLFQISFSSLSHSLSSFCRSSNLFPTLSLRFFSLPAAAPPGRNRLIAVIKAAWLKWNFLLAPPRLSSSFRLNLFSLLVGSINSLSISDSHIRRLWDTERGESESVQLPLAPRYRGNAAANGSGRQLLPFKMTSLLHLEEVKPSITGHAPLKTHWQRREANRCVSTLCVIKVPAVKHDLVYGCAPIQGVHP